MVYFRIKIKCGNITPNNTKKVGKKKDSKMSEIASNFNGGIVGFLEHESNDVIDNNGEDSLRSLHQKNDADVDMRTDNKNENENIIKNDNMNSNNNEIIMR